MTRALTDHERQALVNKLYAESETDVIGFWKIAKQVEEPTGTGEAARQQSLMIVNDLPMKGRVAGNRLTILAVTKPGTTKPPTR